MGRGRGNGGHDSLPNRVHKSAILHMNVVRLLKPYKIWGGKPDSKKKNCQ